MSKRYGLLPSQMLREGTSIDVWVAELAVGYENYLNKRATGQNVPQRPELNQDEMQAMINRVRAKDDKVES